ncbi:polynucleotide adenylyltransferase PcnB [Neptuniibacter caesariensis]|uniref:Poly(A) polymerase I n=1 Tax=Neptuniibacter caesariensis TaxID=207954 RepID=A0A7U8C1N2_NEPCE|nr:polynucleotide adenylyltransferase PcnB [Neptuniibacter caesariensis]EAR59867.1 poly(A) polymerase [Oceanospirillum sp. MED92] [Neptuniibacter caesariensis]
MLKSISNALNKVFGGGNSKPDSQTEEIITTVSKRLINEEEHKISRRFLDDNALKVAYRLQDAGFEGYLVGGCIRDLLLKKRPKDFDVATDAHPEEAAELFRRARLIGRRFKLVHVRFGRDLIEVATFRASHDSQSEEGEGEQGKQCDSGLILRDNVYGTIEDDALRRDFTVNALYYCPKDHCVYDFANGYEDLQKGILRMIGDPEARYKEDPVRMLRAARFAAKLDFTIDPQSELPIIPLAPMLKRIAPARLFDEVLKLFQSGHAVQSYEQLRRLELFEPLFPLVHRTLQQEQLDVPLENLINNALKNTDRRLAQRKSVTPAFLFAAILWYPTQIRMQQLMKEKKMPPLPAMHEAANEILGEQVKSTAIPRRFSTPIREIWEMQLRLPRRQGNRAARLMEHPRFRAAYDLLLLRENSGEDLGGLSQWWTDYQNANEQNRDQMIKHQGSDKPKRPRRRRSKPRKETPQ